jgi:hypothetical protein
MHEAANFEHAKFENELINQWLTWFGTLQGLLFATLALAWTASNLVVVIVCILGVSVALSIGIATHRANVRLDQLDPGSRTECPVALWRGLF